MNSNMLYYELMFLCNDPESGFYHSDQSHNGRDYRIFLYRITSYSYWIKLGATFGRGTVYDITDKLNPVLVSLCMEKFFNVGENPLAPAREDLTSERIKRVVVKSDGSLITVFRDVNGNTIMKSKGSFNSEHVQRAREIYFSDESKSERELTEKILDDFKDRGVSVNFEYTSPENLIVVRYEKPELQFLSIVTHDTGEIHSMAAKENILENFDYEDVLKWVGREGVVIYMDRPNVGSGCQAVKLKSEWYLSLHRVRDEITNPVKVAYAVLNEGIDDIRSAFPEFEDWISLIETEIVHDYNFYQSFMKNIKIHLDKFYSHLAGREYKKSVALETISYIDEMMKDSNDENQKKFLFGSVMGMINEKPLPEEKVFDFFAERCKGITMPSVEKMKM